MGLKTLLLVALILSLYWFDSNALIPLSAGDRGKDNAGKLTTLSHHLNMDPHQSYRPDTTHRQPENAACQPSPRLCPALIDTPETPANDVYSEYSSIRSREQETPYALRRGMDVSALIEIKAEIQIREQALRLVDAESVRTALYGLLNLPARTVSISALTPLCRSVNLQPCAEASIIDKDGNPFTEHILSFVDTFLVLYRPVSTVPIPLRVGHGTSGENDETDQKAFGALTATSLAPRILILISHTHDILRALWFALLYLHMSYRASKRGVAVKFLLDRVVEEWTQRATVVRARMTGMGVGAAEQEQRKADQEWLKRVDRVMTLQKQMEEARRGGLTLAMVWAGMKGMVKPPPSNTIRPNSHQSTPAVNPISRGSPYARPVVKTGEQVANAHSAPTTPATGSMQQSRYDSPESFAQSPSPLPGATLPRFFTQPCADPKDTQMPKTPTMPYSPSPTETSTPMRFGDNRTRLSLSPV